MRTWVSVSTWTGVYTLRATHLFGTVLRAVLEVVARLALGARPHDGDGLFEDGRRLPDREDQVRVVSDPCNSIHHSISLLGTKGLRGSRGDQDESSLFHHGVQQIREALCQFSHFSTNHT